VRAIGKALWRSGKIRKRDLESSAYLLRSDAEFGILEPIPYAPYRTKNATHSRISRASSEAPST
jgi:hypothetical protein